MDKAHDIQQVSFFGTILHLRVDGKHYQVDIAGESERCATRRRNRGRISRYPPPVMEFTGRRWMKICLLTDSSA